jgi:hypothetical protein|nr:MAG TPA: hypothetical protein [Caudoviricetes sp.]
MSRRAERYALLRICEPTPLTPEMVRKMLDMIPEYADIVKMAVEEESESVPKRRVAIYYTTTMSWNKGETQ